MAISYRGAIAFGMVYIPVNLYVSTQDNSIAFNQLHKSCNGRIKYKKTCPACNIDEVKQEDIVKGYEYETDKYVIMTEDDFEKIKTEKDKTIQILHFANISEIDPIYYEKTYYVIPDGSDKALALLRKAMLDENKIAIAKAVFGTKENMVAIRPSENGVLLETMYYLDEIKAVPVPFAPSEVNDAELNMAKMLIGQMTQQYKPDNYHDEYREKVKAAITQKINGQEVVAPQAEQKGGVADLMKALEESLKQQPVGVK